MPAPEWETVWRMSSGRVVAAVALAGPAEFRHLRRLEFCYNVSIMRTIAENANDFVSMGGGVLRVVLSGGFLKSFNQGLLTAALACLALQPGVDSVYLSAFAGIGAASQILSSFAAGSVAERFGLRKALFAVAALAVLSAVLLCVSGSKPGWVCGNVAKGFSFGLIAVLMPVILASGGSRAGTDRASGAFQLSQQIGGILGALTGATFAYVWRNNPAAALRADFLAMAVPAVPFLLAIRGFGGGAATVVRKERPVRKLHLAACVPAVLFMVFMSACGIGTVMEYLAVVFLRRGLDLSGSCAVSAAVHLLPVAAVVLSTALAVRMNAFRRVALGALGMAVGLLGAAFAHGTFFAVCLALASVSFAFGPGACAWGIVPRLISSPYRACGTSVAIVSGQLVSLVLTTMFLPALDWLGLETVLAAFAIMSAAMAVVAVAGGRKAGLV